MVLGPAFHTLRATETGFALLASATARSRVRAASGERRDLAKLGGRLDVIRTWAGERRTRAVGRADLDVFRDPCANVENVARFCADSTFWWPWAQNVERGRFDGRISTSCGRRGPLARLPRCRCTPPHRRPASGWRMAPRQAAPRRSDRRDDLP